MGYFLTPTSYAGSSLSGSFSTTFGPNEVSGQSETTTVTAQVIGGWPVHVDVQRQGRQFALWVRCNDGTAVQRESINRIFDTTKGPDELLVQDSSGCQRIMLCRPLSVFAHPALANSFIIRLEATDPRWLNAAETIQSASVSLATPIQRGNRTMISACAGYANAIVYNADSDSDGGHWRNNDRAHVSSWYAATGCPFPQRALIEWKQGTAAGLRIWNADTASIYMDIASGSADMLPLWPVRDVVAFDGHIAVATEGAGVQLISFRDDTAYRLSPSGLMRYGGNISERSASKAYSTFISTLVTNHATACGLAAMVRFGFPYLAISSSQLTTVWQLQQQRTVDFGTGSDSHRAPYLSPAGDLWFYNLTDERVQMYRGAVTQTSDQADTDATCRLSPTSTPPLWWNSSSMPQVNAITGASRLSSVDGAGDAVFIGHANGVTRVDTAPEANYAWAVQFTSSSWMSDIMPGAPRGMWTWQELAASSLGSGGSVRSIAAAVLSGLPRRAFLYAPGGFIAASIQPPRGTGLDGDNSDYLTARIVSGCSTAVAANKLIDADSGSPFNEYSFEATDEVINYTTGAKTTIVGKDSGTQLDLAADIFTGTDQVYDVQSGGLSASGYDNWYVSAWWNPTVLSGNRWVVTKGFDVVSLSASLSYGLGYNVTDNRLQWYVSSNGTSASKVNATRIDGTVIAPSTNTWMHLLGIYDTSASELRFWLNGSAAGSAAFTGGIYNSLTPLVVGATMTASNTLTGRAVGPVGPVMAGTWSGSLNWTMLARRIHDEGRRALNLANASQSKLYSTSDNVTSLALSRNRHELVVSTASPGAAVSFIEWASSWRSDEYDASTGDTDDTGSSFNLADVTRVSFGDDLLAISGSTSTSAHRLWIEQHFPAALQVTNQGNVDTDIALSFRPKAEKQVGWRRAQIFHLWNTSDQAYTRYPVMVSLDTATLVNRKLVQAGGDDLRVIYGGQEVPRWLTNMNTASTQVWFSVNVPPRARTEGLLIFDNPTAGAPNLPLDSEPAFAWDSGSCNNTTWAYTDFGSRRLGYRQQFTDQVAQWQPAELLPGVDPAALDRQWVTRTQGGGGGVGEVKTMRLTITNSAFDAVDAGESTFTTAGDIRLGRTNLLAYSSGFIFRNVKLASTDRILSARLLVKCRQEMGEDYFNPIDPEVGIGTTFEDYILYSPDNGDRGEVGLRIYTEANASAAAFTSTCRPSQRTVNSQFRDWRITGETDPTALTPGGGWIEGVKYESPSFAPAVQAVLNLSAWASGQDMAIIVKENGSHHSTKDIRFYDAPGVPTVNPVTRIPVVERFSYPPYRKIANASAELIIEYQSAIASVPMADVDPWNDLAVAHSRKGVQAGEPFRNAWALDVPAGVVQVQHSGQFRATSRLPQPGAASPVLVSTETSNVAWAATGNRFYAVTALNAKGETTVGTEGSVNVTSSDLTKPIRVSWQGVRKATGYRIYRGTTTTIYDTVYDIDGTVTTFLDKNDPGKAAVTPSENTATVNAWALYLRNQHGKLVPMFQTTASTENAMAGYGAHISHIYRYDSGPGTFSSNLVSTTDFTCFPSSPSAGDSVYFGAASKFYGLHFYVETAGSHTNRVDWEFDNGAFTAFTPAYNTTAASSACSFTLAGSGAVGWDDGDVTAWVKSAINGVTQYWVRARIATGTTMANPPSNGSVIAGPATTPSASLAFSSNAVVFALEPDTQLAADGQGAFADQVTLKLDGGKVPYILGGSTFLFQDQYQTVRVWSDLEQDAERVLVRGDIRLQQDTVIVDSASGVAVVAQTGRRLAAKKDRPRRRLLRLTPGQNIVQLNDDAGAQNEVIIRHRDAWN